MSPVPGLNAVDATDLELRFGDDVVLAASTFSLPSPGVSVLIGPNGSGKSTLLAAISGLHEPSRGEVRVLGANPHRVQSRIAFVPQATRVNDALPVTVREVVTMGRYASHGLTARLRGDDRAAVEGVIARLGLEDLAGRHLRELSGGQRQRVFVAQGICQDRDLLLLDEPTTALDLVSSRVIEEVIAAEREEGRSVVVTTHDLADAREADHVLLLANRVVAAGPPAEVLTTPHLSEAYRHDLAGTVGDPYLDDAAHQPAAPRHVHVEQGRHGRRS